VVAGLFWLILGMLPAGAGYGKTAEKLLATAAELLELAQISYVYGGSSMGDGDTCNQCNACLEAEKPAAKKRLVACPVCSGCSLDCSHFTELVYRLSGVPYPYLDTKLMIGLSAERLRKNYSLIDLGDRPEFARPGDLLVYDGHVVMLEKLAGTSKNIVRGDIVHATGGRDIKLPGQGIQRERFVEIGHYRGMLRRILRHAALLQSAAGVAAHVEQTPTPPALTPQAKPATGRSRLRPVQPAKPVN
jgi:hypothetical protein